MKVLYVMPEYSEEPQARYARMHDIIQNCGRVGIEPIVCEPKHIKNYLEFVDLVHIPVSGFSSAFSPLRQVDELPVVYGPNFPNVQLKNPREYINTELLVRFLPEFLIEYICFRQDFDLLMYQGEFHRSLIESNYHVEKSSFIFKTTVDTRFFHPEDKENGVLTLGYASGMRVGRGFGYFTKAINLLDGVKGSVASKIPRKFMPDFYNSIDALVFPSVFENSPTVVAESLACGTPVIASDIPPVREIVRDCNSLLFEPRKIDDLLEKIRIFLDNREFYEINARHFYKEYDILPELKKLRECYERLKIGKN